MKAEDGLPRVRRILEQHGDRLGDRQGETGVEGEAEK
jgi:hypothetical protein